jgi:two-component system response regulator AtoC
MAATNRNLKEAVSKGEFREDLYFRLNVVTLTVPPLRERREDMIPLAEEFLARSAVALGKPVRTLGESATALLSRYPFPGNVRELSNLIERAVLFCPGESLEASHFPADIQDNHVTHAARASATTSATAGSVDPAQVHITFRVGEQSLADLEDRIITAVLRRTGGNKTLAAKQLGITRWMLDRRRKN